MFTINIKYQNEDVKNITNDLELVYWGDGGNYQFETYEEAKKILQDYKSSNINNWYLVETCSIEQI